MGSGFLQAVYGYDHKPSTGANRLHRILILSGQG